MTRPNFRVALSYAQKPFEDQVQIHKVGFG